jgi:hypothetical protein
MDLIYSGLLMGALIGLFLILWDSFAPMNVKNIGNGGSGGNA